MNWFFSIFLCFYCSALFSQTVFTATDRKLDSVINSLNSSHKTRYVYLINNVVVVDSMNIKKVQGGKKDSTILITYFDNTQKRVKATEFWGMITYFGERRRFYHGRSFPVWKSESPYFYRVTKKTSDRYYFSETLTGDIHPLSLTAVNQHVLDAGTKNNLNIFIRENLPGNVNDNNKDDEFISDMINGSIDLTMMLLNVLVEFLKSQ